jgi:hypothetical protein
MKIIRICSCLGPSSARKTILRPLLYVNDEHIAILKWSQKFDRTTERSRNGYFKVKFGQNHMFFTRKHPAKKFYSSDTPKAPSPVSTITQSLQMSLKNSKATRADSRRSIMQKYAPYSYWSAPKVLTVTGFSLYTASASRLCAMGRVSRTAPSGQN